MLGFQGLDVYPLTTFKYTEASELTDRGTDLVTD